MFLDFQQKRKIRQFIYSKITVSLVIIVTIYILFSTYKVYQKKIKSEKDLMLTEKKLQELEVKNRQLENDIENFNTDFGIEKEIRSKFFVTKEGEKMVVVVDDINNDNLPEKPKKSFLMKIRDFFGF